jgi:hypothetical protein
MNNTGNLIHEAGGRCNPALVVVGPWQRGPKIECSLTFWQG